MHLLLALPDANKHYEDVLNKGNLRLVYEEGNAGMSYDEFIRTRCNSTTETIRWLVSDSPWERVETPSRELYQISFRYEMDDEDDDPVHSLIVYKDEIYQSYYGLYSLRKTRVLNLASLLQNPRQNWLQITGDPVPPDTNLIVCYLQAKEFDFQRIKPKYESLQK